MCTTVTPARSYVQVVNNVSDCTLPKPKVKRVSFSDSTLDAKERRSISPPELFKPLRFTLDPPVARRPSPRHAIKHSLPAWSAPMLLN